MSAGGVSVGRSGQSRDHARAAFIDVGGVPWGSNAAWLQKRRADPAGALPRRADEYGYDRDSHAAMVQARRRIFVFVAIAAYRLDCVEEINRHGTRGLSAREARHSDEVGVV